MGLIDDATCDTFLDIWKVRQDDWQQVESDPPEGEEIPPQQPRCLECVSNAPTTCGSLEVTGCSPAQACLERNCLCTPEQPVQPTCNASGYPANLCDCAGGCFVEGDGCRSAWIAYVRCINDLCLEACGL